MGKNLTDQFSLLHFATGVVAYFFGIGIVPWIILHTIFEILENTKEGMFFINYYFPFWPGGKTEADTLVNSIGDSIYAIIGYIIAKKLDEYYKNI
jgi:hypothetical protein